MPGTELWGRQRRLVAVLQLPAIAELANCLVALLRNTSGKCLPGAASCNVVARKCNWGQQFVLIGLAIKTFRNAMQEYSSVHQIKSSLPYNRLRVFIYFFSTAHKSTQEDNNEQSLA
jgi:hypothetical protein